MEQHAPRTTTVVVAIILVVIGVVGTFLHLLPNVGGYSGEIAGVVAYVLATIVMLAGIFVRGL
jgi:hypothetical protein